MLIKKKNLEENLKCLKSRETLRSQNCAMKGDPRDKRSVWHCFSSQGICFVRLATERWRMWTGFEQPYGARRKNRRSKVVK